MLGKINGELYPPTTKYMYTTPKSLLVDWSLIMYHAKKLIDIFQCYNDDPNFMRISFSLAIVTPSNEMRHWSWSWNMAHDSCPTL